PKAQRKMLEGSVLLFLCRSWTRLRPEWQRLWCVYVVSIIEQLAQVHNSTTKEALERLCNFLPEKLNLQGMCYLAAAIFGPHLIKVIETEMNADMVCYSLKLCKQDAGQPRCLLYHTPKVSYPCIMKNNLPYEDFDGDKFSAFPTLRGYHWRGKDCNDGRPTVYPGRRTQKSFFFPNQGVDPKDGIPYEQKFCTESKGVILLGDSAGARFHIPTEWMTAAQLSLKSFSNLPLAFTNELDWPQFSGTTGYLNSTIGGWTDSVYLRLYRRNRCNHRDFQNISKNGIMSFIVNITPCLPPISSMARNQLLDNPAIVIYAAIGNDVCNGKPDTVAHMTTPEQMHSNVMQTLDYLNGHLPKGSHVILTGLVDGRFLWDQLHKRYHPLGQLNNDITYEQLYSFLSCLQANPCNDWLSSNKTLRDLTSERALQLSNVLKEIARSKKYANFDIFYMDFPLVEIAEEWHSRGGEAWQLIEPTDGFHPSQIASALGARIFWQKALREWPHILGKENPFNKQIEDVFGDQGGY
uniref:Acyloxyacyl hydrolase n=1 Tax=Sphenodon punctatus TaxID=8508 RepID=A0A8D0GPS7_SPHPU